MKQLLILFCLACCALPLYAEDPLDQLPRMTGTLTDAVNAINNSVVDMRQTGEKLEKFKKVLPPLPQQGDKLPAQKFELIKEQGVVSDYAGIVDAYTKDKVEKLAAELYRITSIKYRVVLVQSMEKIEGLDARSYGQQLYDRWDVGQKKDGLDHGVLLLISIFDSQVKLILGQQVDKFFTPAEKEQMEWAVLAELTQSKLSQGVEVGSGLVVRQILVRWPTNGAWLGGLNWEKASFPLFLLVLIAIALTLVTEGNFIMGFSIAIGGFFGYLFLGALGMVLAGALAFFLNFRMRKK